MADLQLSDLVERPEVLDFLRDREPDFTFERVDLARGAVKAVATLHHHLLATGVAEDVAQHFVLQATWCMFAEDLGLLRERFLTDLVHWIAREPEIARLDPIGQLFVHLGDESRSGVGIYSAVPFANGGLFERAARVELDPTAVELLGRACEADWTQVEPAVFGGLLQSSIDAERRQRVAAHYTPKAKIDLLVQPVVVAPWRERIDAASTLDDAVALLHELSAFRVLDPACGCGNFLYVAYDALRGLEADLRSRIDELAAAQGQPAPSDLPSVPLRNMQGIEIDPFAAELARVVLWIGHALAAERHGGYGEPPLPLPAITNVVQADALRAPWPETGCIVGNPPFHGSQRLRASIGDEQVAWLRKEFGFVSDFCVYWFRRAHDHLAPGQRAGLVATNSVREGRARATSLDYVAEHGGVITDAISTTPWEGDAAVHVSLVAWQREPVDAGLTFALDGEIVTGITTSLTAGDSTPPPVLLPGNAERAFQGPIPVGAGFELTARDAQELLARGDADYSAVVRPFLKGQDITRSPGQRPLQWIIDFGERPLESAERWPAAMNIVRARVKPTRDGNARKLYREKWWVFGEPRPGLRRAVAGLDRYLVCNTYGKRIYFSWQPRRVISNQQAIVFATDEDGVFGVLTSIVHTAWLVRWSSRLKADFRYTPGSVFETFPFPNRDPTHWALIAEAGAAVLAEREARCCPPDRPESDWIGLTTLYNQLDEGAHRPLRDAHRALDEAVLDAYGWPRRLAKPEARDDLLRRLLDRNHALARDPGDYVAFPLSAGGAASLF